MKTIIKLSIRIVLIFTVFKFFNYLSSLIIMIIGWSKNNQMLINASGKIAILKTFLPAIIVLCVYIFIIIVLWIKSEIISEKIIGKNQIENINVTLDLKNALSVGIIFIGIFLFIDSIPMLFSYLSNFAISKTRFVDKDYLRDYTIKEIVEVIGIILKMIVSFLLIKYREEIISKIMATKGEKK
jgi:hypothetical protein